MKKSSLFLILFFQSISSHGIELGRFFTTPEQRFDMDKIKKHQNFSYPCNQEECLYSVPGIPEEGITIENLHPNLYDLYYVTSENDGYKEELIEGKQTFSKPGNILAKKV